MIRFVSVAAATAGALMLLSGEAVAQVRALDFDRFDGRWFEIERSPNDVQRACRRAQIDLAAQEQADRFSILVTCTRTGNGRVETLRANGRTTDETNARLRFSLTGILSFGGLAGQNYWVWDRDAEYRWAILALPDKSDWWIWHRDPDVSQTERDRLLARARTLGLDASRVIRTPPRE
jgi:apolipoprotein D and lipocalin family protein